MVTKKSNDFKNRAEDDATEKDIRDRTKDDATEKELDRSIQTRKVNADLLEQALIDARNVKKKTKQAQDFPGDPVLRDPAEDTKKTNVAEQIKEANFYLEQELFTDAHDVLEKVVEKEPENSAANAKLAEIEQLRSNPPGPDPDTGRDDQGSPEDQDTAGFYPEEDSQPVEYSPLTHPTLDESDVHLVAGIAHMQAGRFDQALDELNEALYWDQNAMICHLLIGACYFNKGTAVKAIKHFKNGLHIDGISIMETIPFYYELGKTYEFLRDSQEAIYYYTKVAKIYPDHPDIQKKIATLSEEEEPSSF